MKLIVLGIFIAMLGCASTGPSHCDFEHFESTQGLNASDAGFLPEYDYDSDGYISASDFSSFLVECT